jgi:uncharacterized protein (DUF885 family)
VSWLKRLAVACVLATPLAGPARGDDLLHFAEDFWAWRADRQPYSTDDLPRIERPAHHAPDWSPAALHRRLEDLARYETRWSALAPASGAALAEQVDHRLLGSALARVRFELAVEAAPRRNPDFYVDQTLGGLLELVLPPPPFTPARAEAILAQLRSFPATLSAARENLSDLRTPFAERAIGALEHADEALDAAVSSLAPELPAPSAAALRAALPAARQALRDYRTWLQERLPGARTDTAIGRDAYLYFLRNVALVPETPEDLLALARAEWSRAVAFEALEGVRDAALPRPTLAPSLAAQVEAEARAEVQVRAFLAQRHLLTVPAETPRYLNAPLPAWVRALADYGSIDDFPGTSRPRDPGVRYLPEPGPGLGFFSRSMAEDPRPIIVHEGIPGHFFQLWLGNRHPDSIRRHYYDSGSNEGIGFYAEEMLLQAGLFDDAPRTRETLYRFMRLRALRVEVDVRLALGEFTLAEAADYLERTVPMDRASAIEEATLFASTPGQAISYQAGKLALVRLLADTRRREGEAFSLQRFHDALWRDGNVPLSLQRWERLGDPADVPAPSAPPSPSP